MPPEARLSGQAGLTLVELVVAIVVIAIGVTAVLGLLAEGYRGSPDPQLRIKQAELAQAYMEEVFPKAFDHDGSVEARQRRDDLEDYDGLQEGEACGWAPLQGSEGFPRSGRYNGYCVEVKVWDGAGVGPHNDPDVAVPLVNVSDASDVRRIQVIVTDPRGQAASFAAYRLDYGP